jgi:hypothetical protein
LLPRDGINFDPGSFRDRTSRVFLSGDGVYRCLNEEALAHWQMLVGRQFFARLTAEGRLVRTEQIDPGEVLADRDAQAWAAVLHHERIPFLSYPHEWSFGMLQDAAKLQLELMAAALEEGMILKDASPYNVQWCGAKSVFIDIPSFIAYQPGDSWVGYRQFCQLFLYPLLLQAYKGVPFQPWLRAELGGIEPQHCWRLMSWRDLLRPGVLSHVFLHSRLESSYSDKSKDVGGRMRKAGFDRELIVANVRGLLRLVQRLQWQAARSEWSEYETDHSYTPAGLAAKEAFVRRVAASRRWKLAWDLGANTGRFSRLVSEHADYVVAMDQDYLAVERHYQRLKREGGNSILPLVMNLADPSVNRGWRGLERKGIVGRGRPELTLCLALMHHLVITAHIPLTDFVRWLAELGAPAVVEFVTREDPMVQRLLRYRRETFDEYDLPVFERCAAECFRMIEREVLPGGTRVMFHLQPLAPRT